MNKLLPSVKSLITLAALLCFLFQASAASAQKVSLSVRNATVKAAIERLQKDYGYSFVIKTKDADVNKKITLDVKNEEIGAVVGKMFAGQNVVSSVEGKMIAIMSAPAKRDAAARASANAVVKGVVKDSAGNPITGATVIVDGTTIGATTDLDGSFSVRIGARTDVRLIVSYLGLKTREVAVDDPARFYEVRLENDNMALDEVVVVGYGTQRRSLVTNAISQFKPTEENMRSVMSPSELLQGRIAAGADIGKDAVHDILHILFGADVPVQNFLRFQLVKIIQLDHFSSSCLCKVSRSFSSMVSICRCLNW